MTVFDLSENEGVWFEMEGGGRVQLRIPGFRDWQRIRKATVRKEPFVYEQKEKPPILMEREITDEDGQLEMIWDVSIVSWEKLFDANENPMPCNKDMKIFLLTMEDPTFRDYYNEKIKFLTEAKAAQKEQAEKN